MFPDVQRTGPAEDVLHGDCVIKQQIMLKIEHIFKVKDIPDMKT